MTQIEKALIGSLADIAALAADIGEAQMKMADLIAKHLPDLPERERKDLLARSTKSLQDLQTFRQQTRNLKKLVR